MITPDYIRLMSAYSQWQNSSLLEAAGSLTVAERQRQRGAFFGSIEATLNHLLWGDQLWLHRLAGTPAPQPSDIPTSLQTASDWAQLVAMRETTDQNMLAWAARVSAADLHGSLSWFSGAIQAQVERPRWALVIQLFNHGTHHRGQVHCMLTAAGAEPDDTDVPFMDSPHFSWADTGG